jgi:HK97 family phage prohead protease
MPMKKEREYRAMLNPMTAAAATKRIDSTHYVEGVATTFDKPYEMYECDGIKYYERIDRDALVGADMSDVIMRYDHKGRVLARMSNGTLKLEATESRLLVFADLSKSTAAKELYDEIAARLIISMSWAFSVLEETYDKTTHTRIIHKFKKVYDVAPVSIPANADTDISARSYFNGAIEIEKQELLVRRAKILKIKTLLEG